MILTNRRHRKAVVAENGFVPAGDIGAADFCIRMLAGVTAQIVVEGVVATIKCPAIVAGREEFDAPIERRHALSCWACQA